MEWIISWSSWRASAWNSIVSVVMTDKSLPLCVDRAPETIAGAWGSCGTRPPRRAARRLSALLAGLSVHGLPEQVGVAVVAGGGPRPLAGEATEGRGGGRPRGREGR